MDPLLMSLLRQDTAKLLRPPLIVESQPLRALLALSDLARCFAPACHKIRFYGAHVSRVGRGVLFEVCEECVA
jgi:hypothetical protein